MNNNMETIKENKNKIISEYLRFCNDMLYVTRNKDVITDFAGHYIEHYIGCFGFFNNDYFKTKDLIKIKNEIVSILEKEVL